MSNRGADVKITIKNGKYVFKTGSLRQVPEHLDLVDALNQLFLCMCYITVSQLIKARLVHCAGFVENNIQTLVFGKKAGKSSLILEKMRHGATTLSDDLLMWLPNKTEFLYLGLPIRMRHPLVGWEEHSKKKSELIGV